jgi:hypothetical protein
MSPFNFLAAHTQTIGAQLHMIVSFHEFDKRLIASLAYSPDNGTNILDQLVDGNFSSAQKATSLLCI